MRRGHALSGRSSTLLRGAPGGGVGRQPVAARAMRWRTTSRLRAMLILSAGSVGGTGITSCSRTLTSEPVELLPRLGSKFSGRFDPEVAPELQHGIVRLVLSQEAQTEPVVGRAVISVVPKGCLEKPLRVDCVTGIKQGDSHG